jgi:hypothetical protein
MLYQMKVEYEKECAVRILQDVFEAYCKMWYQHPLENLKKMIVWKTCHVWQRLEPDVLRIDTTKTCLEFHRAYYVCGMVSVSGWLSDIIKDIFFEWIWWHFVISCTRNSYGFWRVIDTFLGNEGKNLANCMTNICTMTLTVFVKRNGVFMKYKKLSCSFLYHSLTQNIPNFNNPKQSCITNGLSS